MDLIFIDEKGAKIQAGIKSHLIPVFDGQLQEDAVVILSKFGVGENKDLYKVVVHDYKINFYRCTTITPVRDWQDFEYSFNFRAYQDILQGEALNSLSVDVAGSVVWCGDLEFFGRPPKETKKINFDIQDLEGFKEFISKTPAHEHAIAVIQHGKCKEWKGEYTVRSDKFATRMFLNEEIDEVNQLRRRLQVDILFLQEMSCVVVVTIKIVQEEYGWFYPACHKCFKKVMAKSEYLQNVENVSDYIVQLPVTSLVCPKCRSECTSITTKFKVQVRVQDESGSVSFVMFDRDVQKLLGLAVSDLRERQVKNSILKMTIVFIPCKKTCGDPVIIVELLGGDGNGDENTDEVTQEVAEVKDVNLSESSQVSAERTSRDVVSVTADSSAVEVEKDSGSSPNESGQLKILML
ncbi:uncharacterized protein LOC110928917 [Helianthus annuus]|uniref:uncharacterized protein LOC110928917 n=1 Tax=Helianthus annuus TaxID=4232 RepID=UPI000B9062F9|nr:uncharacterized protein LOC110928917 [Helianthus annuus]